MMFFKHPKTLPELNITANGNLIDTRPIEKLKHIYWTTHTHTKKDNNNNNNKYSKCILQNNARRQYKLSP